MAKMENGNFEDDFNDDIDDDLDEKIGRRIDIQFRNWAKKTPSSYNRRRQALSSWPLAP
ncbi:hypothetical protein [Oenococcus oeni]|uniref:hypothetical protein n=1 Tax=Oenococcus oeni TaxID=1247 RepID=UPI000A736003|nr:hypothetical protein [Oenococcus oeni]